MSQNCECNTDLTMLPVKGLVLAVDTSNLPSGCECGPSSGESLDYSLEEQFTGKHWIDGKKIYQKTIELGPLNKGIKIPLGVENIDKIIEFSCLSGGTNANIYSTYPLPFISGKTAYNMGLWIENNEIEVNTYGIDRTWLVGHATIQYTCTDR